MQYTHMPVMLREVIGALNVRKGDFLYIDGTAGLGGHAEAIAELGGQVVCIDRDGEALAMCEARLKKFGGNVRYIHGNFRDMKRLLANAGVTAADGVLLDLGVSSMQLDDPERGFSYRHSVPLDMRMDRSQGERADRIVNGLSHQELANILKLYGEERYAAQIARGIIKARPIATTGELAEIIAGSMPAKGRAEAQHPARRTFQAIRIAVNEELEAVEEGVNAALSLLTGRAGRLAVISFHSLEDRIVKQIFAKAAKGCDCPPSFPACVCGKKPILKLLGRIKPKPDETDSNPRAASAVLRVAETINSMP